MVLGAWFRKSMSAGRGYEMTVRRGAVPCCLLLVLLGFVGPAAAVTVPGNFPTIQQAINAVAAGALPNGTLIEVQPGSYNEAINIGSTVASFTVRAVGGPAGT